jgi:hypothetical protein
MLIVKNINNILAGYDIKYEVNQYNNISDSHLKHLRMNLLGIDKSGHLMLDGIHLLSSLDGLHWAQKHRDNKLILTSSCVYSIINIISSVASLLWIKKYNSSYRKWESGINFSYDEFYLNKNECIEIIKNEFDYVAKWFLDNKLVSFLTDEMVEIIQNDYNAWKRNELLLLSGNKGKARMR